MIASIANINLAFQANDPFLSFQIENSIKEYLHKSANTTPIDYTIGYSLVKEIDAGSYKLQFKGDPEKNEFLNYKWEVYTCNHHILLKVHYFNHISIKEVGAFLNKDSSKIQIEIVCIENNNIEIDPLIHPLGSLLLLYVMNWENAVLLHGSAVNFNNNTFVFTGVSGIGKSTMAKLWTECGAEVINDDRIILKPEREHVKVYNNPMPYYTQYPRSGNLKGIFLLNQSAENYIRPISGVLAYSKVLGNCIQQFL